MVRHSELVCRDEAGGTVEGEITNRELMVTAVDFPSQVLGYVAFSQVCLWKP